ncbi:hypothetical protein AB0D78_41220 [Streptomyces avermitilis]|uniref:hypothetical protein n=1 Tax=Streptomyces avermitilis TaxID=33903 RepID=UPI003403B3F7
MGRPDPGRSGCGIQGPRRGGVRTPATSGNAALCPPRSGAAVQQYTGRLRGAVRVALEARRSGRRLAHAEPAQKCARLAGCRTLGRDCDGPGATRLATPSGQQQYAQ